MNWPARHSIWVNGSSDNFQISFDNCFFPVTSASANHCDRSGLRASTSVAWLVTHGRNRFFSRISSERRDCDSSPSSPDTASSRQEWQDPLRQENERFAPPRSIASRAVSPLPRRYFLPSYLIQLLDAISLLQLSQARLRRHIMQMSSGD